MPRYNTVDDEMNYEDPDFVFDTEFDNVNTYTRLRFANERRNVFYN